MPAERLAPRLDAFDLLRTTRQLAPHDAGVNDHRWLIGEALRRLHARADLGPRAIDPGRVRSGGFRAAGSEIATDARRKLARFEETLGPAHWQIVRRIVLEGGCVAACRHMIPEILTPWRADCCVMDRLRVALDRLAPLLKLER